jgi:hypothetical protein
MFGSSVLDVMLGTTFVFLLVALGVTAANELIASLFRWRAQNLAAGLREILDDPQGKALKKLLYAHPLIKSLYRDKKGPSYIPSRLFAMALLDIISPAQPGKPRTVEAVRDGIASLKGKIQGQAQKEAGELPSSSVQRILTVLLERAEGEVERREQALVRLEQYVELWFNGAMDRVSGWYKRRLQIMSIVVAGVFVIGLNIDAIYIVRGLSRDGVLRAALTAQASKLVDTPTPTAVQAEPAAVTAATVKAYTDLQDGVGKLKGLGIPMGWSDELGEMDAAQSPMNGAWAVRKFFGLMLTTLAALLGAPFWFDVLNKVMSVRSAIKPSTDLPALATQPARPTEIFANSTTVEVVTPLAPSSDIVTVRDSVQ